MTLPTPRLDDRAFDDLMVEARRRIPALCPDWTDLGPSDPGVTVLELVAWMTETLLYRVNRIPEKTFVSLLGLIGVKLRGPAAARTWLAFSVAERDTDEDLPIIREGSRLSSGSPGMDAIEFETCAPLNLTAARVVRICYRHGDSFSDVHCSEGQSKRAKPLCMGGIVVPHHLYLGDPELAAGAPNRLLYVDLVFAQRAESALDIEWERWDGAAWIPWLARDDTTQGMRRNGALAFEMPRAMPDARVEGRNSTWLRARLVGNRATRFPEIQDVRLHFEVPISSGVPFDCLYVRTPDQLFHDVTNSDEFPAFGPESSTGSVLYLGSKLFSNERAHFSVSVEIADRDPVTYEAREKFELVWEYYSSGSTWQLLGTATQDGVFDAKHGFEDETGCFLQSGQISFRRPPEMAQPTVLGERGWFIRARITSGSLDVFLRCLRLSFIEEPKQWEYILTVNEADFQDMSRDAHSKSPFTPFFINKEQGTALYVALSKKPAPRVQRLFIDIEPGETAGTPQIVWSYRTPQGWVPINIIRDETHGFSSPGALELVAPGDWTESEEVPATIAYWLRASWTVADLRSAPRIGGIYLNTVEAIQARSRYEEVLGRRGEAARGAPSGIVQAPFQVYSFAEGSILSGPEILVKELNSPTDVQLKSLIDELGRERVIEQGGHFGRVSAVWARWEEVDTFFDSGPYDRHYVIDPISGTVTFGDGRHGMIPPTGLVKARSYRTTAGSRGNLQAMGVFTPQESHTLVTGVTNVVPAAGGADEETIEDAKRRGPSVLRHRQRAVTVRDFEDLAREASTEVARAHCHCGRDRLLVIVVPKTEEAQPNPSWSLVKRVQHHLDMRRLITTRVSVEGPHYEDIDLHLEIELSAGYLGRFTEVQQHVREDLRRFTHPLLGGPQATGWPIGRTLHISEIYYCLEQIEGVDHAIRVMMRPTDTQKWVDKVRLGAVSYPYLGSIDVAQV